MENAEKSNYSLRSATGQFLLCVVGFYQEVSKKNVKIVHGSRLNGSDYLIKINIFLYSPTWLK